MISNVGDILVEDEVITPEQLKKAMDDQKKEGGKLGSSLVKLGFIEEKKAGRVFKQEVWDSFN